MSEFEDLLAYGFTEVSAQASQMIVRGAESARCVSLPLTEVKMMKDSGFMPDLDTSVELLRTDSVRLGIELRSVCQMDGKWLRVIGYDDDRVDPCVQVHFKLEQAPAVPR